MAPYHRQFKDEYEFEAYQDRVGPSLEDPYEESVSRCLCCNRYFDDHGGRYELCLTCETGGCRSDGTAPAPACSHIHTHTRRAIGAARG
jgi:hypothetical protein